MLPYCSCLATPRGQNLCFVSQAWEQSQGHWTHLAEAVLDLGTVTGVPQSSNYCHLVWVSDLEQGAGQHAVSRCQQTNHGQSYGSS